MNHIALQQFKPHERKSQQNCIWCGHFSPKNRAHIICRKLSTGARKAPILRLSVCHKCNLACGNLERWILRYTPLGWIRMMLYLSPGSKATSVYVPSYFFSSVLNNWVVFHLNGSTRSYAIPTQLLLLPNSDTKLLSQAPLDVQAHQLHRMITALRKDMCKIDVRASLPEDFSPRLLLDNENIILIVRSDIEKMQFTKKILQIERKPSISEQLHLEPTGEECYHFQWSRVNWARFCAKTAFEALCLFEGGDKCTRAAFQVVRDFVLSGTSKTAREIVFDEKGPRDLQDTPTPVHIDLTPDQTAPRPLAVILPHSEPGMHIVILYEIRGWVIASVVFAGFPPSVLVIGGPNEHLSDLYMLIFDYEERSYDFLRLAYDKNEPIIPLPIPGDGFLDLAETYRLVDV